MEHCKSFFMLFFTVFVCSSQAHVLHVGGSHGWVVNPSEPYNHWAGRMRFQVNDTLVFKYKNSEDSVLVVSKDDYESCNVSGTPTVAAPVEKTDDGGSCFKFSRSGHFYFITGNSFHCHQGQKMIIVVLAIRNRNPAPSYSPVSAPTQTLAPTISPSSSTSPIGSSPSPVSAPTQSLAPTISPSPSISPIGSSPTPSVTPSQGGGDGDDSSVHQGGNNSGSSSVKMISVGMVLGLLAISSGGILFP